MADTNPIQKLAVLPEAKEHIARFECETERLIDAIEVRLGRELTDVRVTEKVLRSRVDHVFISDLAEALAYLGVGADDDFETAQEKVIQFFLEIRVLFLLFALPREEIFALKDEEKAERFFAGVLATEIPYEIALRSLRHIGIADAFGTFPAHPLWPRFAKGSTFFA